MFREWRGTVTGGPRNAKSRIEKSWRPLNSVSNQPSKMPSNHWWPETHGDKSESPGHRNELPFFTAEVCLRTIFPPAAPFAPPRGGDQFFGTSRMFQAVSSDIRKWPPHRNFYVQQQHPSSNRA